VKARLGTLVWLAAGAGVAAPIEPRQQPADYPVHAAAANASIGAEFLGHTARVGDRTILVEDYIVIEVGVFPRAKDLVARHAHFDLRINGKQVLLAQTPQMVAASLKYPDWERRPEINVQAGDGERAVILGRRQPVERFPGDRRPTQDRLPPPPKSPEPGGRPGQEAPAVPDHELIVEAALPEQSLTVAAAGYLYFPRRGDFKSIRSLELRYEGPAGTAVLKLR
jgi:hypothetical protein